MAENVRVVVRCRPMNKREHALKSRNIINIEDCSVSVENPTDPNGPAKTFTFDSVYDALAPTEAIYNDICYSLVDNVLEGYNGTIFAYGQTGCGKTHTMQGPDADGTSSLGSIPSSQRGIISRSFDHIFEAISLANDVRYLALVSYLEIYNENIRDLLNPSESITANHALKELPGIGVTVPSLSSQTVHNASECYQLLNIGNRNRMVGATLMNASSSRSHSIFTISLEQIKSEDTTDQDDTVDAIDVSASGGIRRGKLNLVDLAGSERQNKTGAVGERLREATKINLSLSALGNVISALVDGKTKHIPYRDSKLTRLLQDSLGGNTKTLMISCISPADVNYDETISTLRYASRAKNIANKPKINEDPKDAKLREYQEEIMQLKRLLSESGPVSAPSPPTNTALAVRDDQLQVERAQLRLEMSAEMERLRAEHAQQQREKQEQLQEMEELRQHYEQQLKQLSTAASYEKEEEQLQQQHVAAAEPASHSVNTTPPSSDTLQLEARKRIELIKQALIGGERANDVQLRERRQKKKIAAQRRLSALAQLLSRVEQHEDRDLLQGHYTNIQQELNAKNDCLKAYRQKVKALEREVSDLHAEFQLDRADYLESIRRLERNLKFYLQLMDKALPILRKDGKYWYPDEILQNSCWNDDLKVWKFPETAMNSFKLPLANSNTIRVMSTAAAGSSRINDAAFTDGDANNSRQSTATTPATSNTTAASTMPLEEQHPTQLLKINDETTGSTREDDSYKRDILNNYFRSNRQKLATSVGVDISLQSKEYASRRHLLLQQPKPKNFQQEKIYSEQYFQRGHINSVLREHALGAAGNIGRRLAAEEDTNRVLSSWLGANSANNNNNDSLNKTWAGGGGGNYGNGTFQLVSNADNFRK